MRVIPTICVGLVLCTFVNLLWDDDFQTESYLYPFLFTPAHMTKVNGMAVTFAMDMEYIFVGKPDGYSKEKAESILKEYTEEDIKRLRSAAKLILPERVKYYSEIMGVAPKSIKINSAKKRYGSCSGENNINFSLYLMDKDERFIDYVVVHELAHIRHHNHSKAFYSFIEEFLPDYKERKKLG